MAAFLDRLARHWFLFIVLFGGVCLGIAGGFGLDYGIPSLFRDDLGFAEKYGLPGLVASPALLTQLMATFFATVVWSFAVYLDDRKERYPDNRGWLGECLFFAPRIALFALISLAAATLPIFGTVEAAGRWEVVRGLIGVGVGLVVSFAYILLSRGLARALKIDRKFVLFGLLLLAIVIIWLQQKLVPALAIFVLLCSLTALYVGLNFFREPLRIPLVIALVVAIVLLNRLDYKYTFPHMTAGKGSTYYDPGRLVRLTAEQTPVIAGRPRSRSFKPVSAGKTLIDPVVALSNWKTFHEIRGGTTKPKLVLVTTSGGAYRAAFWTAIILDELRKRSGRDGELVGLINNIRVVTGASGGMIGAAYMAVMDPPELDKWSDKTSLVSRIERDILKAQETARRLHTSFPIARDSLSAVAQQLVQRDLLHLFVPFRRRVDRGKVLETHWRTLAMSFGEASGFERLGLRPSMIFSPMLVETGQPLLISNLDLEEAGFVETLPGFSRTQGRAYGQRSHFALEFFKLFPLAHNDFQVRTAVRMSATFPYVSPAVELPTIPPRRVVDAGFYDNYGMATALAYLSQQRVIDWVKKNTSGVVIIQINAYPTEVRYPEVKDKACREGATGAAKKSALSNAFEFLTSPLEGVEAARQASMVFRNQQGFKMLQLAYGNENGHNFLEKVSFENAARSSFSWYLPATDLKCMQGQLTARHNREAMNRLKQIWAFRKPE